MNTFCLILKSKGYICLKVENLVQKPEVNVYVYLYITQKCIFVAFAH